MQDARIGVRRLQALEEVAVGVAIERDTQSDELPDACGALIDQDSHGLGVGEAGARPQGVGDVIGDAVVGEHHARDAALGVAGVGVFEHVLGDEGHTHPGRDRMEGDRQSGDAASDENGMHGALPHVGGAPARSGRRHDRLSATSAGASGGFAASIRSRASRAGSATSRGTETRFSTSPATRPSSTHAR